MARKLSRKQRQQQKLKQRNLLKNRGYSEKQVNQLSNKEISKLSNTIITQDRQKEQKRRKALEKYKKAQEQLQWKRNALFKMGIEPELLKTTVLRSVRIEDIRNGNVTPFNYPELFPNHIPKKAPKFNYSKIYKLPAGQGLYIAFRDFAGEEDFEKLLKRYNKMSNTKLLGIINALLNTPPSYNKEEDIKRRREGLPGTSNGRAGEYRWSLAPVDVLERYEGINYYSHTFPQRKRQHTPGKADGFQVLVPGDKNSEEFKTHNKIKHKYITEFSAHSLLVVSAVIMSYVTEEDRFAFYKRMYSDVTGYFPELTEVLPEPKRY